MEKTPFFLHYLRPLLQLLQLTGVSVFLKRFFCTMSHPFFEARVCKNNVLTHHSGNGAFGWLSGADQSFVFCREAGLKRVAAVAMSRLKAAAKRMVLKPGGN
jgi:hypothetical protein